MKLLASDLPAVSKTMGWQGKERSNKGGYLYYCIYVKHKQYIIPCTTRVNICKYENQHISALYHIHILSYILVNHIHIYIYMPHVSKYGFPTGLTPNVIGDFEFASLGVKNHPQDLHPMEKNRLGQVGRVRWYGIPGDK